MFFKKTKQLKQLCEARAEVIRLQEIQIDLLKQSVASLEKATKTQTETIEIIKADSTLGDREFLNQLKVSL